MGIREYARYRNVHLKTVQDAITAGRIPTIKDPVSGKQKINPSIADPMWAAMTDFTKVPATSKMSLPIAEDPGFSHTELMEIKSPDDDEDLADDESNNSRSMYNSAKRFAAARADKEEHLAKLKEVELRKKGGELVPAADIRKEFFGIGKSIKDSLLNLPAKIAHELEGKDRTNISIILEKRIREALIDLAGPGGEEND